jgi:hypothetical protein
MELLENCQLFHMYKQRTPCGHLTWRKSETKVEMMLCISGDGNVSFEEFVEIVSNMGAATDRTADQEEKELRDAFRVSEQEKQT